MKPLKDYSDAELDAATKTPKRMAYIGAKPCGCVVWMSLDDPSLREDNAKMMAELIREGYTVERVSTDDARARWNTCTHSPDATA